MGRAGRAEAAGWMSALAAADGWGEQELGEVYLVVLLMLSPSGHILVPGQICRSGRGAHKPHGAS